MSRHPIAGPSPLGRFDRPAALACIVVLSTGACAGRKEQAGGPGGPGAANPAAEMGPAGSGYGAPTPPWPAGYSAAGPTRSSPPLPQSTPPAPERGHSADALRLDGSCFGSLECTDAQGESTGGWSFRIGIANNTVVSALVSNSCTTGPIWSGQATSLSVPVVRDGTTIVPLRCTVTGASAGESEQDCPLSFQLRSGEIRIADMPGSNGRTATGSCSWLVR